MTLKELLDNWESESDAANDCIVEILESYMEFVDIFEKTINAKNIDKVKPLAKMLIHQRRSQWGELLKKAKEIQNGTAKSI